MSGRKGQLHRVVREDTVREQAWQNMLYFGAGGFRITDLLMTVPGAAASNMRKWLARLEAHGVIHCIEKEDRPRRKSRRFVVARESRLHPLVCTRCGQRIPARECSAGEAGGGGVDG